MSDVAEAIAAVLITALITSWIWGPFVIAALMLIYAK